MIQDLIDPFFSVFHPYSNIKSTLADKCMEWMELTFGKILPPIEQEDDGRERTVLGEEQAEQVKRLTEGFAKYRKECLPAEIVTEFQELENNVLSSDYIIGKVVAQVASNLRFLSTKREKERYAITLLFPFKKIASNKDRYKKILRLSFSDRYCVQNCLQLLYGAMILFADYLDVVLIEHGIDLLALQDEWNIHLIKERNTHAAYKLLGKTLADKYLSALPKRQGVQPQPEQLDIDIKLAKERIDSYCEKAIQAGFMEKTDSGYCWNYGGNRGKVRLAYFISKIYCEQGDRIPYKSIGQLFGVNRLDSSVQQLTNSHQLWMAQIDGIFDK